MQYEIRWHEDVWPVANVKDWILTVIPEAKRIEGPQVLGYKNAMWGQIARFTVDGQPVIFKGCSLPLFSERIAIELLLSLYCSEYVPELLAHKELPDKATWTLHRAYKGRRIKETNSFENILSMTHTLARVQARIAQLMPDEIAPLHLVSIERIPEMFDYMLNRIENGYLDAWLANNASLLDSYPLPVDVVAQLKYFRPKVAEWTQEIRNENWPITIDHVDFDTSNVAIQDDGRILIFDWEQAVLSFPFFSVARYLYEIDGFEDIPTRPFQVKGHLTLTPNRMAVRNAYIDAIPWNTRAKRERAFNLAMCLVPIKASFENELLSHALDNVGIGINSTAYYFGHALHCWQAMDSIRP